MIKVIQAIFGKGLKQFLDHPQLWFTAFVACAIVFSFLYTASTFISIAKDAEERLINVRVGSIHDAFVPFAEELDASKDALRRYMTVIRDSNETITDFFLVQKSVEDQTWSIIVSPNIEEEGKNSEDYDFVLSLSLTDPRVSFTIEDIKHGERFFNTARALTDKNGEVVGAVVTRQTLSAADQRIATTIQDSVLILGGILIFLLILFFRHARIVDYTSLYQKLKEVDELKDDFIGMASHELRTPLTSIRGYASILQEKKDKTPEASEMLSRIDISAKELDQLIADILDVSKIEKGGMSFEMKPLDPHTVVEEVFEALKSRAEAKGLVLEYQEASGVSIHVDTVRFKQVLMNLVGNSIKYTQKGTIRIESKIEMEKYVLRISDTGIGMTAEEQKKLFGKFYRASGEDVRAQTGTGLGLWITKQIVERMGGTISVESIKGVGSHFIVSLPIAK